MEYRSHGVSVHQQLNPEKSKTRAFYTNLTHCVIMKGQITSQNCTPYQFQVGESWSIRTDIHDNPYMK